MRFKKIALTTVFASAMVMAAMSPGMAGPHDGASDGQSERGHGAGSSSEILEALQRDLGLSAEEARELGAQQRRALALDEELQAELGQAWAGSAFDDRTGRLTVMVSDPQKMDRVRASGADAQQVRHSRAKLEAITAALDAAAGRRATAGPQARKASGPRKFGAAGLSSWYIDVASNSVRVVVKKGQRGKAEKLLAKYGDAVTIKEAATPAVPTDRYVDGGDAYNGGSCSIGFNLRNKSTGQGYVLTAGHCVNSGSTVKGHDGTSFGKVLESWFPTYDDALVRNDSNGYWYQGPWVDKAPTHGSVHTTYGHTDGPVGTIICKSGRTTGYTCGQITGKDETVSYGSQTVYGLTRHDACVEKGDSGGANVSLKYNWSTSRWDYAAEGVTSGARLWWKDGRLRCGDAVGTDSVSWYYPIADSLAYYGPKYSITTW